MDFLLEVNYQKKELKLPAYNFILFNYYFSIVESSGNLIKIISSKNTPNIIIELPLIIFNTSAHKPLRAVQQAFLGY